MENNWNTLCPVLTRFDGSPDLNIWDADFVNLQAFVTPLTSLIIDARYTANAPGIAEDYLGSNRLWWVIIMYNGLSDAIKDLYPGRVIKIPDPDKLNTYFTNKRSSSSSSHLPTKANRIL